MLARIVAIIRYCTVTSDILRFILHYFSQKSISTVNFGHITCKQFVCQTFGIKGAITLSSFWANIRYLHLITVSLPVSSLLQYEPLQLEKLHAVVPQNFFFKTERVSKASRLYIFINLHVIRQVLVAVCHGQNILVVFVKMPFPVSRWITFRPKYTRERLVSFIPITLSRTVLAGLPLFIMCAIISSCKWSLFSLALSIRLE